MLIWHYFIVMFHQCLKMGLTMKSFKQIKSEQAASLAKLIEFAGGQSRLARGLNVSPQVVQNWVKRGRISAVCAIDAERETNGYITKEELRPDVAEWVKD